MEQYIPKVTVVAEIERLRKIQPTDEFQPKEQNKIDWLAGKEFAIITLQVFLDTLEVKEVYLEKEFELFLDNIEGVPRMWHSDEQIEWAKDIAKHFFELGLKAQKGE